MSGFSDLNLEKFRKRIRLMTDDHLARTGKTIAFLLSNFEPGQNPPEIFTLQLAAVREEIARRDATENRKAAKSRS